MSKYNLSELLTEVAGGRIGTLKISARELVDKMDDVEARGIDVDRYDGLSPDGKTYLEFHVHPEGRDEPDASFSVYDFKFGFDPMSPEHSMEEYPFSVGGRGGEALRNAKTLLGAEAYRMEENKEEIKEDKEKDLINALRFQVMTLEKGIIDKDDFINAIEELAFGSRRGPNTDDDFEREQRMQMSMREEENVNEEMAPTGIGISGDQLKDLIKLGAIAGVEVIVRDKDGKNVRKVDYTLTNTSFEKDPDDIDYVNEDLKKHFNRFK
jgi:hypothetical protein